MTLLRDVQAAATSSQTDLPTLLRQCLVLAARVGSEELRTWVNSELRGYQRTDELPDYRVRHTHVRGTLRAGFEVARNLPIPIFKLDDEIREEVSTLRLFQGVAALERMAQSEELSLRAALTAEMVLLLDEGLGPDTHCLNAYRVIAVQDLVEVLDTVRTRILDFALELEKLHPESGADDTRLEADTKVPGAASAIHQLFVTVILGNQQGALTVGSTSTQTVTNSNVGAVAQGAAATATGVTTGKDE